MIYLFSDLMMEWKDDEISKLIDFVEKTSFMYVIRHFSGARNCGELASYFSCKFLVGLNSFCYQFLVPVSGACVAGFTQTRVRNGWHQLKDCHRAQSQFQPNKRHLDSLFLQNI